MGEFPIALFEKIVRKSYQITEARTEPSGGLHPFDNRNIHPGLPPIVRSLFDNGHFSQATFEAYKFIDNQVQHHAKNGASGFKLMMAAFSEKSPQIKLNGLSSTSEKDEQKGYQFLFSGAVMAIRNPRGHVVAVPDGPDTCLDHLSLASLLLRRLEDAGFLVPNIT